MGKQVVPTRKAAQPLPVTPDTAAPLPNAKTPPAFQLKADPIQKKDKEAVPVTKTEAEIAEKKAQIALDPSIIAPDQDFNPSDPKIVNRALELANYKTIDKLDEKTNLCGVNINGGINPLMKPKIDKVNQAFADLQNSSDPLKKQQAEEITKMIQKIGGANFRVQKKNFVDMDKWYAPYGLLGYKRVKMSDHALGTAVDVNANTVTMQNAHFDNNMKKGRKQTNDLMELVEKVVREKDATFDLDKAQGVDMMTRINTFSDNFPAYFEKIMAKHNDGTITDYWAQEADTLKLLRKLTAKKGSDKELKLILKHWEIIKGWAKGTSSKLFKEGDDHQVLSGPNQVNYGEKGRLNLLGIVDINATFLQMMKDAGFAWGGEFGRGNLDFMHFEDREAKAQMKK